jgi:ferredoxin
MSYIVDFEPVGRRRPCPGGESLLDAARDPGVDLASICGGGSSCGSCRVQIVAGKVTPATLNEDGELSAEELAQGSRLACQAEPLSD